MACEESREECIDENKIKGEPWKYDTVSLEKSADLSVLAMAAGIKLKTIKDFNEIGTFLNIYKYKEFEFKSITKGKVAAKEVNVFPLPVRIQDFWCTNLWRFEH